MSVEPAAPQPEREPGPRWPVPPVGGWTADDLDTLPNLPPHTELIDGSLIFVSPQSIFHERAVDLFKWQLRSVAPPTSRSFARSRSTSTNAIGPSRTWWSYAQMS